VPIYEYECIDCGARFDVEHSANARPLKKCGKHCPNGHKNGRVRKVFHPATIIFKGSGWHIKDYGTSKNGGRRSGKEKEPAGTSDSSKSTESGSSSTD